MLSKRSWRQYRHLVAVGLVVLLVAPGRAMGGEAAEYLATPPPQLAPPMVDGAWLRPAEEGPAEPVWGIHEGIAVGLWPMAGPRGLIRIYTPYLGQQPPRMINFISVEPVVEHPRGQSELEYSELDGVRGKAMWSMDHIESDPHARPPWRPARGIVEDRGESQRLRVFVAVERFHNGARPIIEIVLRQDRPHEVAFRIWAAEDSAVMESCVLSATMGNYALVRQLWLADEVVDARDLWREYTPDRLNFAPWREFAADRLLRVGEDVIVAATSDEADPAAADYAEEVPPHWRYHGKPATQYWRTGAEALWEVAVNGRRTYWGEQGDIPGGVSFENFELRLPFRPGQELRFGVTPEGPQELGFDP